MRAREGPASRKSTPDQSEFKMGTLLSRVATYPSGALRRAEASGDRAIAIAVRDARRGRRASICAEDRDGLLGSVPLTADNPRQGVLRDLQIVLCEF